MKYKNKELRTMAREALRGNYPVLIAAQFLLILGGFLVSTILSQVFPGSDRMSEILYWICNFVASLILIVFDAGMYVMYLHVSRGEEYSYRDLLYFVRKNPDRVIVAGFFLAVISTILSLPVTIAMWRVPENIYADVRRTLIWCISVIGIYFLSEVLRILVTISLILTYWCLSDDETLGGIGALKRSYTMMRGQKRRYFCLILGFAPYMVLGVLSFGIGMLWIIPYMKITESFFYRELTGEPLPWYGSDISRFRDLPDTGNDYNAEA